MVVVVGVTDADPLLQTYVEAPVALSVDVCPAHIVAGVALAETVGKGFKVTVTVAVPVQPASELPVTEYVVVAAGVAVNEDPLPDGLHV